MITPVTPPTRGLVLPCPASPSKASFSYKMTVGSEVSDNTLKLCANLFSSNYGIWGNQAATISKFTVAGKQVKMTSARLQSQCSSHLESSVLVTCYIQVDPLESEHPQLYRHTFATVWDYGENKVGWVMQLVVDEAVHQCYITTHLLQALKCHTLFACVNIVGLVLSHPAACNALAKCAAANIKDVELDFICQYAKGILASSPISYLKATQLRGSLFQDSYDNRAISSVFTKFYVDHTEPLAVLEQYKKKGQWCLDELLDRHEFLAVFPIAPVSPVCDNN
ncbi:uncharacterized protein BJ212DRAFT_1274027 [Suillus subaureus]|uniref:Uncharacterized protein n=1 Tax=Suillus subaureus TaxID=48587 RepID=A0A9P7JCJ4_9AGAM|nr:uncharacterized protein BJ212DRAFT_1274027 [Suillus subaureus]KAG1814629.1 hypothetical protein BJ212DRAFT_1274027 [Suillus subaureus]